MAGLRFSVSNLSALAGFAIVAAICSGLNIFAGYFFLGRLLMYFASAVALGLTVAGASRLKISRARLTRLVPLVCVAGVFSTLTLLLVVASPSRNGGKAMYLLTLTVLILSSAAMTSLLSTTRGIPEKYSTKAILFGFLFSAFMVIVDPIIDIRAAVPGFSAGLYERTRAGGLYLQPNLAGVALSIFFAALAPRVSQFWASICAFLLIVAVVLTFSRSAMVLTAIVLMTSVITGKLTLRILFPFAVLWIVFGSGLDIVALLQDTFKIDAGSGLVRLNNLSQMINSRAVEQDSRTVLLTAAFGTFAQSPLVGYGPGYSWEWAEIHGQGTHNIYLRFMLEYGIIGFLIWPGLMVAFYKMRHPALPRIWALTILFMGLFIGLFSHNLTEDSPVLVALAAAYVLPLAKGQRMVAKGS